MGLVSWITQRFAPTSRRKSLGSRGELLAARYLRKHGHKVLLMNYKAAGAEIDIVARQGDQLVFVEVKTRRSNEINEPYRQVNHHKQHNITRAARVYLKYYKDHPPRVRFDVISIVWPEQGEPQIQHLINAFQAT
jgi:putative endonuclease